MQPVLRKHNCVFQLNLIYFGERKKKENSGSRFHIFSTLPAREVWLNYKNINSESSDKQKTILSPICRCRHSKALSSYQYNMTQRHEARYGSLSGPNTDKLDVFIMFIQLQYSCVWKGGLHVGRV